MNALHRAWWRIEDNTSPTFRAFVAVAAFLLAVLGAAL